jgi:hypothetical protein
MMAHDACREFVSLFEQSVDGLISLAEVYDAGRAAAIDTLGHLVGPFYLAVTAATAIASGQGCKTAVLECSGVPSDQTDEPEWLAAVREEGAVACTFIRDIFGPLPFRQSPPLPPAVLAWNDRTIPRLAQAIYEEPQLPAGALDTARLAILADALLDAGCDDDELIAHCRSAGPHVRGCWAVDLILGKMYIFRPTYPIADYQTAHHDNPVPILA